MAKKPGPKPKNPEELYIRKYITMPPELWQKIANERQLGESDSSLIRRLINHYFKEK